ncbi:hypothetical protein Tco_0845812 [Tanacetum coccineum]
MNSPDTSSRATIAELVEVRQCASIGSSCLYFVDESSWIGVWKYKSVLFFRGICTCRALWVAVSSDNSQQPVEDLRSRLDETILRVKTLLMVGADHADIATFRVDPVYFSVVLCRPPHKQNIFQFSQTSLKCLTSAQLLDRVSRWLTKVGCFMNCGTERMTSMLQEKAFKDISFHAVLGSSLLGALVEAGSFPDRLLLDPRSVPAEGSSYHCLSLELLASILSIMIFFSSLFEEICSYSMRCIGIFDDSHRELQTRVMIPSSIVQGIVGLQY